MDSPALAACRDDVASLVMFLQVGGDVSRQCTDDLDGGFVLLKVLNVICNAAAALRISVNSSASRADPAAENLVD